MKSTRLGPPRFSKGREANFFQEGAKSPLVPCNMINSPPKSRITMNRVEPWRMEG